MSFRLFKKIFDDTLRETPLPNGDIWKLQILHNMGLRDSQDWFEVLYRTRGCYKCDHGHTWKSSWSMISFRFRLDFSKGFGIIRMKRFGVRCKKCNNDNTYHMGQVHPKQIWETVQNLLLYIVLKCYEGRHDYDIDVRQFIIPVSDVPKGRFGGMPHPRHLCEACAHGRCQEIYNTLTK